MENELQEQIECTHEWLIESPNGPISKGTCSNCGQVSEFKNSMPVSGWDRTDNSKSNDAKKKQAESEKKQAESEKKQAESGKK